MPQQHDQQSAQTAQQVGVRCTLEEHDALCAAAEALNITLSSLLELGAVTAVTDLGVLLGTDTTPRIRPGFAWPFAPLRPEGSSSARRITPYIPAPYFRSVEAVAWALRLSVPHFLIGATLRYIALRRLDNDRRRKADPSYSAAIAALKVPYGFDALVRA
jgi:hypothetical protein